MALKYPFVETRLDPRVSAGAMGGPEWSTTVTTMTGGQEYPNQEWTYPRHKYDLANALTTAERFERVAAAFYACRGRATGFRFKDWADYQLTQANSALTLISGSVYQINRAYAFGATTLLRPIYKPVASTIVVYRTRSGVITTASATVDGTTGQATISGHVAGDTYTCTGEFDVPVRFDTDLAQFELQRATRGFLKRWDISLIELKNPA